MAKDAGLSNEKINRDKKKPNWRNSVGVFKNDKELLDIVNCVT